MTTGYYIIIRGPMASGKTTISEKLATNLQGEYIPIDRILDTLDEEVQNEWEDGVMSQRAFIQANRLGAEAARKHLTKGRPVVFDGNFYWRSQVDDLVRRLDFPHCSFTLRVPLEICIRRDAGRNRSYGREAVEAVYRKSTEFDFGVVVDATLPLEKVVKEVLSALPLALPGDAQYVPLKS